MAVSKTDRVVAEWLRQRNPGWTAARVNWQIARSYVIDEHPDWDDAQVDREVTRRLGSSNSNSRGEE